MKPKVIAKKTHEWVKKDGKIIGIKCLVCGLTSYGEDDIKHKYCGRCHIFHKG
jgi:uncharacterized OB-fold protein